MGAARAVTAESTSQNPSLCQTGCLEPGLMSVYEAELLQWLAMLSVFIFFISRASALSNPTCRGFYSLQASGIHFQEQFPLLAAVFADWFFFNTEEFRAKCSEILCTCVSVAELPP